MTTPVSAGRRTTIETLGAQHRIVLARLNELDDGGPEPARMEALLAFLAGELEEHLVLEERALFPVLARHTQVTARPVAGMEAEHGELRALVGELTCALRAGGAGRAQSVGRVIAALLRAHIDKEDHVLFPLAERMLTLAELEEVDARAAAGSNRPPAPPGNLEGAAASALGRGGGGTQSE